MDKRAYIAAIAKDTGQSAAAIESVLASAQRIADIVVKSGGELKLVGWMKMGSAVRGERMGRNPKTGEAIKIPAQRRVFIKPSEKFGK